MKKHLVLILLVLCFVATLILAKRAEADTRLPDTGIYIEYSRTMINSSLTMAGLGYRTNNNKWDVALQYIGEGDTKNGEQTAEPIFSVSRIVNPPWVLARGQYFMRMGVAYTPDNKLVGDTTYRLGVGLRWDFVELEYGHISSGDLWKNNTGIDFVTLRFMLK